MSDRPDAVDIRRAIAADSDAVAEVMLQAWRIAYDFPAAHSDDEVRGWVRETLLPGTETWVATDAVGHVVAMLSLSDAMLDQLYVAPPWIGRGLGSRLLALAKDRRPDGLDLYTFTVNERARRFYEARGFVIVATGDGSANEEHQPDIRYAWRPDVSRP